MSPAEVDAVVAACPGVRVLATSRERLGLLDEALVPVGPLAEEEARELLVDRARLVDPHFELRPTSSATPTGCARLVDRLPLGLELVARHLQLLRLDELVERVEADLAPVGRRSRPRPDRPVGGPRCQRRPPRRRSSGASWSPWR